MYQVLKRYEYWSNKGKVFTEWFKLNEFKTEDECKKYIKHLPRTTNKLKQEYKYISD